MKDTIVDTDSKSIHHAMTKGKYRRQKKKKKLI